MASKRVELAAHLSAGELKERTRARKGVDAKETRRWQALWLCSQGQNTAQVSAACALSESWVREIKRRYNAQGAAGVTDGHQRRPGGARALLSEKQRAELAALLEAPVPAELGGGLWSGRKVARWVKAATGRLIRPQQGCVYLRQLGFGLRVPRPRHRKAASPEERAAFKKTRRGGDAGPKRLPASPGGSLGRG
jgi:transposase